MKMLPGDIWVCYSGDGNAQIRRLIIEVNGFMITSKVLRCDWDTDYEGNTDTLDWSSTTIEGWELDEASRVIAILKEYDEM
jgi:hypothetical protein